MIGYAGVLGSIAFSAYATVNKVESFDDRIGKTEKEITTLTGQLKEVIEAQKSSDRKQTEKLDLVIQLLQKK